MQYVLEFRGEGRRIHDIPSCLQMSLATTMDSQFDIVSLSVRWPSGGGEYGHVW